jgi:hypothetical protein
VLLLDGSIAVHEAVECSLQRLICFLLSVPLSANLKSEEGDVPVIVENESVDV